MLAFVKVAIYIDIVCLASLLAFKYCLRPEFKREVDWRAFTIALGLPAIALVVENYYVFIAAMAVIPAAMARNRDELARNYLFALPTFPMLTNPLKIGSLWLFDMTPVIALGSCALLSLIYKGKRKPGSKMAFALYPIIVILLSTLAQARGVSITSVLRTALSATLLFLPPFIVVARAGATKEVIGKALLRISMAGFLSSFVAIFEARRAWPLYENYYKAFGLDLPAGSQSVNIRAGFLRAPGPVSDPSSLGLFLGLALLSTLGARDFFDRRLFKWIVGAEILALLATQSRGAWIATCAGYLAVLVFRRKGRNAIGFVLAGIVAWFIAAVAVPMSSRLDELLGKHGHGAVTADYRKDLLREGLREVWKHPLTGQSNDQLQISLADLTQGQHIIDEVNQHLTEAMSLGLIGFLVWIVAWMTPMAALFGLRKRVNADGAASAYASALLGGLCVYFVGLTFTSAIDRNIVWPVVMCGLAIPVTALCRSGIRPRGEEQRRSIVAEEYGLVQGDEKQRGDQNRPPALIDKQETNA